LGGGEGGEYGDGEKAANGRGEVEDVAKIERNPRKKLTTPVVPNVGTEPKGTRKDSQEGEMKGGGGRSS